MEDQTMYARTHLKTLLIATACITLLPTSTRACEYHMLLTQVENNGVWSIDSGPATLSKTSFTTASNVASLNFNDPAIDNWKLATGATGHSANNTIENVVNQITADVAQVAYTSTNVYIRASGVPSHDVGPFTGNPAAPSDRNRTFRIPRSPL